MKGTPLSEQYRQLSTRLGKKRAILAVTHTMLVMAYDMIQRQEPYHEARADFLTGCSRKTPLGALSNDWNI